MPPAKLERLPRVHVHQPGTNARRAIPSLSTHGGGAQPVVQVEGRHARHRAERGSEHQRETTPEKKRTSNEQNKNGSDLNRKRKKEIGGQGTPQRSAWGQTSRAPTAPRVNEVGRITTEPLSICTASPEVPRDDSFCKNRHAQVLFTAYSVNSR